MAKKPDLLPVPQTVDERLLAYLNENFRRIADAVGLTTATGHTHSHDTDLTGVSADDHHAQAHSLASHSSKAHSELTGVGADDHHAQAHTHPESVPTGAIFFTADDTVPTGWLICDGQAVSRTTYSALYNLIGTTYGVGDGSTTFNVPDLRGRVVVHRDSGDTDWDALGETRGAKTHTLVTAEMPSHQHGFQASQTSFVGGGSGGGAANITGGGTAYRTFGNLAAAGGDGAHNNLQPSIVLNGIIKT